MAAKKLDASQFRNDLIALGFHVVGNAGPISTWTFYDAGYNEVSFDGLMAILDVAVPGVYYKDAQGYHYVDQSATVTPSVPGVGTGSGSNVGTGGGTSTTGADVVTLPSYTPGSSNQEGVWYRDGQVVSPYEQVGITYGSTVESLVQEDPTIDGDALRQQLQWQEDAAYNAAIYGPILAEAFGINYSSQEWFILASGAQGSGLMRAKIAEAQNRIAFRENWRLYHNGADPDPGDYNWVTENYVSPNEYTTRMAAKESAKQMFAKVNDLLMRTLNHSVTLAELENLAVGGAGSGELEALIDEATRLDAFTDDLYQWLGRVPTADDYAREVAKFSSVDAFKWEITVSEQVKQLGDEINNALQRTGQRRYTEQELRIMLGKSEGWGDLQKAYDKALKEDERLDTSRRYGMQAEKITPVYTSAFQGGVKEALPELPDVGGM